MKEYSSIDDERITTFGRLIEAHEKLTDLLNDEMERAVGLPLLWYGVLLLVGRSPHGVRPIGELINATAFTSGGVTRLVDRMELAGLVERRRCPTDRRVQYVGLTPKGCDMLARATEVHVRGIQRYIFDVLDEDEVAQLDAALEKLVSGGKTCQELQTEHAG
jgi:MarR family transcriptional regulator, 2-MHQ and catechol-resistance regulon repressor